MSDLEHRYWTACKALQSNQDETRKGGIEDLIRLAVSPDTCDTAAGQSAARRLAHNFGATVANMSEADARAAVGL